MPPPMSTSKEAGHIWMVTGPAGCGKTTVATHLSQSLGLPYLEGDNVCPNVVVLAERKLIICIVSSTIEH